MSEDDATPAAPPTGTRPHRRSLPLTIWHSPFVQSVRRLVEGFVFIALFVLGEAALTQLVRQLHSPIQNDTVKFLLDGFDSGSILGVGILFAIHFVVVYIDYIRDFGRRRED